ncbi:hypothetical protein [Chamaesiphon sp. VAR_48_metabat_403]|uniref:hypothetical protein n=1 Tax=Chamaesiphon sp. VAR_48_metabat_403 TaxID=2964700 RepID=UPI00286DE77F|nr:hypothetical protein [Chamaesiphon sp. VAR_48_metabat_403]
MKICRLGKATLYPTAPIFDPNDITRSTIARIVGLRHETYVGKFRHYSNSRSSDRSFDRLILAKQVTSCN